MRNIPYCKIIATIGGTALTGAAVWMNAEHVAAGEGWQSPLVAAGVIVTLCAAVSPPFAERAAKDGQTAKAALLWLFFGLAVCFSLSASITRSSDYVADKAGDIQSAQQAAKIAKEKHADLTAQRDAECATGIGANCRALRKQVTDAWANYETLAQAAPTKSADAGNERLAAVLRIDQATVALYTPLFLPLGLELGGFIFLAFGLAPRRREAAIAVQPATTEVATPIKVAKPIVLPAQSLAKAGAIGTRAYYLQRLENEHPKLASQVRDGQLSVFRASIAAGLRKEPKTRKWDANAFA